MSATRNINTVVYAPPFNAGGVKSLYSVCEWLNELGHSTIEPFYLPKLASWFEHRCRLYDDSYTPDLLIYPEIFQPYIKGRFHLCFALGKHFTVQPHADLVVCKSTEILHWVKEQHADIPTALTLPSIKRATFEYDGRPKQDRICYMTKPHKHPETAELLRERYGDRVLEIVRFSEEEVASALRSAKVFVWRGHDHEGSPRPPKEALVAGCVVVGLESDLNERYHTNFGVRCSTVDELIEMAGEALSMPMPTEEERAVVRDSEDEKRDWLALVRGLELKKDGASWLRRLVESLRIDPTPHSRA